MADADNEESLLLAFKESGIEFIEEATKSASELADGMKDLDKAGQEAVEVLKEESTVLDKLNESILNLKRGRQDLTDKYVAGIINEEKYNDASKDLEKTLSQKEATLKRVTQSVSEQIKEQQRLADEMAADAARAKEVADSYLNVAMASDTAGDALATAGSKAEAAAGTGEGESGKGGFAGVASGAMKAEKAIHSLASGQGLGRLGGMLEGVLGPMGIPGLGMALGAFAYELEPMIPKIKDWVDAWEMGVKTIDDVTAAIDRLNRAHGKTREQRALVRIDSQIAKLEDKEDEQGWLSPVDQDNLRKLRETSSAKHQETEWEEAAKERKKREEAAAKEHEKIEADAEKEADHERSAIEREHHQNEVQAERERRQAEVQAEREHHQNEVQAERERRQAKTRADREAREAKTKADREAREATPEAQNRRAAAAQQNEAMGEAQRQNQLRGQYGGAEHPAFEASDLQQVVASVARNRTANSSLGFTLAQQVDYYMGQLEAKMVADFQRGMGGLRGNQRSNQNTTGPF